MNIKDT